MNESERRGLRIGDTVEAVRDYTDIAGFKWTKGKQYKITQMYFKYPCVEVDAPIGELADSPIMEEDIRFFRVANKKEEK